MDDDLIPLMYVDEKKYNDMIFLVVTKSFRIRLIA